MWKATLRFHDIILNVITEFTIFFIIITLKFGIICVYTGRKFSKFHFFCPLIYILLNSHIVFYQFIFHLVFYVFFYNILNTILVHTCHIDHLFIYYIHIWYFILFTNEFFYIIYLFWSFLTYIFQSKEFFFKNTSNVFINFTNNAKLFELFI